MDLHLRDGVRNPSERVIVSLSWSLIAAQLENRTECRSAHGVRSVRRGRRRPARGETWSAKSCHDRSHARWASWPTTRRRTSDGCSQRSYRNELAMCASRRSSSSPAGARTARFSSVASGRSGMRASRSSCSPAARARRPPSTCSSHGRRSRCWSSAAQNLLPAPDTIEQVVAPFVEPDDRDDDLPARPGERAGPLHGLRRAPALEPAPPDQPRGLQSGRAVRNWSSWSTAATS